uniref:Farnesylated proteins-converting enzyme 2 n=1 Tax=Parascaris univalens TaxID=6257 RepID=A0A915AEB4_PARUN
FIYSTFTADCDNVVSVILQYVAAQRLFTVILWNFCLVVANMIHSKTMECAFNLMLAAGISCSYVGLLYAFDFNGVDRNDPLSIKRRFFAAVVNNMIGILVTYILLHRHHAEPLRVMGIHTQGALPALVLPAILTSICYLGTWVMTYIDGHIGSLFGKCSFFTFLMLQNEST